VNETFREQVASAYGLDGRAAAFLVGTTLHELEASLEKFVELLDRSGDREAETAGLFADIAAAQAQRMQALATLFAGRPAASPRDELGRFAPAGGGFDGAVWPQTLRRAGSHDELIARLAIESRVYRGAF
jgi:hypothetical protein